MENLDIIDFIGNSVSEGDFKVAFSKLYDWIQELIPVGTIIAYAGSDTSTPPPSFLICDGSSLSVDSYPELYEVIGTTYGSDDSGVEFKLPDLTSRYLQGSLTPGLYLDEGLPDITGSFPIDDSVTYGTLSGAFTLGSNSYNQDWTSKTGSVGYYINFNASSSNSIYGVSDTVQPLSMTVRYIIKYI